MIVSVVLFNLAWPNTGFAGRYGSHMVMENCNVFPRALQISDSTLLSSCTPILPLIMTSQEIRVKQVNYLFWNMAILVHNQQLPLETVHVATQHM